MSDRLEQKIDRLDERLDTIDVTLARLTETVVQHEKRSTSLESLVGVMQSDLQQRIKEHEESTTASINENRKELSQQIDPIQSHVREVKIGIKLFRWVAGVTIPLLLTAILKFLLEGF